MLKKIIASFPLAWRTIHSHFFRTVLSILGIVIGVAALVVILSLIDGLERLARQQISTTTSVTSIAIHTEPTKMINGVRVRKDTFSIVTYAMFKELDSVYRTRATFYLRSSFAREIACTSHAATAGATIHGVSPSLMSKVTLQQGQLLDTADFDMGKKVVLINNVLAASILADSLKWNDLIGDTLVAAGYRLVVKGIVSSSLKAAEAFVPFTTVHLQDLATYPPQCLAEANKVELVTPLCDDIKTYLAARSVDASDFIIQTNEFRVAQVTKGFLLFRVVMGLIVGISVLVGGIGVMNVLVISVTERTVEIGVRKAVGATRKDIVMQFLAESITVSVLGSSLGLLLGFLGTLAAVPVVKLIVDVPFEAAYTWNTFLVVSSIALLIGLIFGTYPAMRASRLDPVEAMRRE